MSMKNWPFSCLCLSETLPKTSNHPLDVPLNHIHQVEQALEHPYLASLHDLSDEPVCPDAITFDFDSETLTPDGVREVGPVGDSPSAVGLGFKESNRHLLPGGLPSP